MCASTVRTSCPTWNMVRTTCASMVRTTYGADYLCKYGTEYLCKSGTEYLWRTRNQYQACRDACLAFVALRTGCNGWTARLTLPDFQIGFAIGVCALEASSFTWLSSLPSSSSVVFGLGSARLGFVHQTSFASAFLADEAGFLADEVVFLAGGACHFQKQPRLRKRWPQDFQAAVMSLNTRSSCSLASWGY